MQNRIQSQSHQCNTFPHTDMGTSAVSCDITDAFDALCEEQISLSIVKAFCAGAGVDTNMQKNHIDSGEGGSAVVLPSVVISVRKSTAGNGCLGSHRSSDKSLAVLEDELRRCIDRSGKRHFTALYNYITERDSCHYNSSSSVYSSSPEAQAVRKFSSSAICDMVSSRTACLTILGDNDNLQVSSSSSSLKPLIVGRLVFLVDINAKLSTIRLKTGRLIISDFINRGWLDVLLPPHKKGQVHEHSTCVSYDSNLIISKLATQSDFSSSLHNPTLPFFSTFGGDTSGIILENMPIIGIDDLYAYIGVYISNTRDDIGGHQFLIEDSGKGYGKRIRSANGREGGPCFGVLGRIPVPSALLSSVEGNDIFPSSNSYPHRSKDFNRATGLSPHVLWLNISTRPKKMREQQEIRWVRAPTDHTVASKLPLASIIMFSYQFKLYKREQSAEISLEKVFFSVTEIEEAHLLSITSTEITVSEMTACPMITLSSIQELVSCSMKQTLYRHQRWNRGNMISDDLERNNVAVSSDAVNHFVTYLSDPIAPFFTQNWMVNHVIPTTNQIPKSNKTKNNNKNMTSGCVIKDGRYTVTKEVINREFIFKKSLKVFQLSLDHFSASNTAYRLNHTVPRPMGDKLADIMKHLMIMSSFGYSHNDTNKTTTEVPIHETGFIEFKNHISVKNQNASESRAYVDSERIRHTIGAMASTCGGFIFVGINDDGRVIGHTPGAVKGYVTSFIDGKSRPILRTSCFIPALPKDNITVTEFSVKELRDSISSSTLFPSEGKKEDVGDGAPKKNLLEQLLAAAKERQVNASISHKPSSKEEKKKGRDVSEEHKVVTMISVRVGAAPFYLASYAPCSGRGGLQPMVRGVGGNAKLSICAMVTRVCEFIGE